MKSNYKPSLSNRASVRSLIVACLPAAAVAFVANSTVLGAVFGECTGHDLTVDDNHGAATNCPSTNSSGINTNIEMPLSGIRG
jgi:hypothetical protein